MRAGLLGAASNRRGGALRCVLPLRRGAARGTPTSVRLGVVLLLLALSCSGVALGVSGEDLPVVVVFYEEGCPDCAKMDEVLVALGPDLPATAVQRYEISEPGAMRTLRRLLAAYKVDSESIKTPVLFIGDTVVVGGGRAQELRVTDAISRCARAPCPSPLARIDTAAFPWRDAARLALLAALVVLLALLQFS